MCVLHVSAFFDVQCLIWGKKRKTKQKKEMLCTLVNVIQKPYSTNLKANYTLAMASAFLQHNGNKLRPKLSELFSFSCPLHR